MVNPYKSKEYMNVVVNLKERNFCTAIALWCVTGKDLLDCLELMKIHGRKHRQGMSWLQIDNALYSMNNFKIKKGPYTKKNRITLGQFIKKHSIGKYFLLCRGHTLAVIDGEIHDHTEGLRRQITCAYRVYSKDEL